MTVPEEAIISITAFHGFAVEAVKTFSDTKFESTLHVVSADKIIAFIEKVPHDTRAEGYCYLLEKIARNRPKEDPLTVRVMAKLQKYPSIPKGIPCIPGVVRYIFTDGTKCIQTRLHQRQLQLEQSWHRFVPITKGILFSHCCRMDWRFRPVKDGKYFAIRNVRRSVALGVESVPESSGQKRISVSSFGMESNPSYQWTINVVCEQSEFYLQFINRQTKLLLDVDAKGFVSPRSYNGGANQHWKLSA